MFNSSQKHRHKQAKRCAFCDGKFGLVRYYSWRQRSALIVSRTAERATTIGYVDC